ncbi:Cyclochlorotine biosynthesis protein O [Colletotrichum trifolii]|uniref:Cyclochlorotine biosynthesis protein O n=1 Tax=Colletotrichum trifolii TaxID=5466 RepID=A0A4R8RFE5_COLTR|nr:Cyclochlorotine biosynthesis protein O [Colletotrichum trifolii]
MWPKSVVSKDFATYETIKDIEDDKHDSKYCTVPENFWPSLKQRFREPTVLALVFQSLVIIAFCALFLAGRKPGKPDDLQCARQLSPYSPYIDSGDLEFVEYTEQNHLMQPSPFRGKPTPEVEEAWIRLWRVPPIRFPEDKLPALNKMPADKYEHVPESLGGGVKGFLNVFHQLHCLNLVRQYTYREDYDYSNVTAFRAPAELVRGHIDHCIETIRKSLMCTADVTPVLFEKDPSRPSGSKSDFNLWRKCRNFEKIQDWTIKHKGV